MFKELSKLDLAEHIENKGNLNYISWAWAVHFLMEHDPTATWEFPEPKHFGDTVMVFCNVTAFGKTLKMQLPVMDNRNNALAKPDARKISDATMRCLAKCIACFGIGLYIYAGEDLPLGDDSEGDFNEFKGSVVEPKPLPMPKALVPIEIATEVKLIRSLQNELNILDADFQAELYRLYKTDTMKNLTLKELRAFTNVFQTEKTARSK